MANDYFYYEQIRRYHLQFNRIFSTFRWKTGITASGFSELRTVPCLPAPGSRQVEQILRDGKETATNTIPQFATYISDVKLVPERRQDPDHVRSLPISERNLDKTSGQYGVSLGNQYTIESYMPVPYDLVMKCDLITSNINQKHQLMEQIMVLFNPMIDLQTSDNSFDWTALGVVELTDIQWTSVSMPSTEDEADVTSMTFRLPIWLSPPSKVKRQTIIHEIITNIGELDNMQEGWQSDGSYYTSSATISEVVTTPGNMRISIEGLGIANTYKVKLLESSQLDRAGNKFTWPSLLAEYKTFKDNSSQLIIIDEYDGLDTGIIKCAGTLSLTTDDMTLLWTINPNSLPPLSSTIPNVIDVIDPDITNPSKLGFKKPEAGDRYIVMGNIYQGGLVWGEILTKSETDIISATANSVIQFNGSQWEVIFDGSDPHQEVWSYNQSSEDFIHFSKGNWIMTLEGEYNPGNWRLRL